MLPLSTCLEGKYPFNSTNSLSMILLLLHFSRLLTCEADKTIKIWKENSTASENSHPIDMKSWTKEWTSLKRY
jgi:hypothetical protein